MSSHSDSQSDAEVQPMPHVTVRVPDQQKRKVDRLVETGVFASRSEAIRAGIRGLLAEHDVREREDWRWRDG
jgi:Arc/MetJ-type ribon-helix-helix transcriptional regulator